MSRLDGLIQQAKTDLAAANALPSETDEQKATKATKVAAAQATLNTLETQKSAIENDINDAVQGRLPDPKVAQKKAIAAAFGIQPDQVTDEMIQQAKQAYEGQQSEIERANNAKTAAETRATNLETQAETNKRLAENARKSLEAQLIQNAIDAELLNQGVIHETEGNNPQSYLELARQQAIKEGTVTAEVEVNAETGDLQVKTAAKGMADAVKKAREKYPVFFRGNGDDFTIFNPRQTPQNQGGGGGGGQGYSPAYNLPPGVQQQQQR